MTYEPLEKKYDCLKNAKVISVSVGTHAHDGRGFFSIGLEGKGWGQGTTLRWDQGTVDKLIEVCGSSDLFSCKGALVRVCYKDRYEPIQALAHILDETKVLVIRES